MIVRLSEFYYCFFIFNEFVYFVVKFKMCSYYYVYGLYLNLFIWIYVLIVKKKI